MVENKWYTVFIKAHTSTPNYNVFKKNTTRTNFHEHCKDKI